MSKKLRNELKSLNVRIESLELFLGVSFAHPANIDDVDNGEHYWNNSSEWGVLQDIVEERKKNQKK